MIAADTSSLIAYLQDEQGKDVALIEEALQGKYLVISPMVLTELLSAPDLPSSVASLLLQIPLLELTEGFWQRAGKTRTGVLAQKRKARVADALIAQSCLDSDIALITRDKDFRHFASSLSLKILG
jgi:predicted nucleic acid-binding protein